MEEVNWWNVYSKVWVKSNALKIRSVCLGIRVFLSHLFGRQLCPSPHQCFSTGVPRNLRVPRVLAAMGSVEKDQNCLGWNSQTQFYVVVAVPLFHSRIWFHEQRKNLRKVPLQQKGWKTLPYTSLSRQRYFRNPSQNPLEQRKEVTFDRGLANIRAPVVLGFYCPSSQSLIEKTLHEITVNNKG